MNLIRNDTDDVIGGVPRAGGDEPIHRHEAQPLGVCSPRGRG